ncbi:MAG: hypothetical protein BIFFINMI_01223 [Phycisphaerae bacterium]|nr:hypothetical protein [Phycisphaerae bacterium]
MPQKIEFVRLVGTERRVGETLASVSRHWRGKDEKFLFVSPHDDDVVVGGGLMMQLAARESVPVHLLVATDGRMGYCSADEQRAIADIRRRETYAAYGKLGVPEERIHWLGFPDCSLTAFQGRRPAGPGEPDIAGYTGLQNALTHIIRKVAPSQIFVPTWADLHPDHKLVHQELMISIFHAGGDIWPELGPPLTRLPHVTEMAVYCDFPTPPSLRIRTAPEMLQNKLDAIAAFASQRQIDLVVRTIRDAGPEEFFRSIDLRMYQPARYRSMFDQPQGLYALP